ncbi:MAG: phage integrase N-terminal SAM-like domain-containing protein, partial [Nitrososphaeraceae archaeon]|nr:phage integrase N-terminal SAM-like domain-containing protein [Nitrososphaeraceae archaeon]
MNASTDQTIISYDVTQNQKIINDYIQARKTETNLATNTQVVTSDTLNRFSRYVNKNFNDVTRDDIILFLNSVRKSETQEAMPKWIGTY